ncbi:MAG: hypothetical protein BXU00_02640 [Candidatus Nanoclepta minutus]|uniref:Uncharacterized protein n=1 Tax=Candidatus Nanoclepta minutus TaxID=1940235 RepID=A0A397WMR2_9ARCH|nr:MAG: hypothetical protein BXU00_02640 [Candidatus Nanoclepta minutus]
MKTQYILVASLILLSILFSIFYNTTSQNKKSDIELYKRNLEDEIYYISRELSKSYVGNFLRDFKFYIENLGYNFTFICISPIYLGIDICKDLNSVNCCYYFNSSINVNKTLLKFCDKEFAIYNEGILCICYNISSGNSYYSDFICT